MTTRAHLLACMLSMLVAVPCRAQAPAQPLGGLGLSFERNTGHFPPEVRFLARMGHRTVFITDREAVVVLPGRPGGSKRSHAVRVRLEGSRGASQTRGVDRQPGVVNYLIGQDRSRWRTGVPTYGRVRLSSVYPGIDLVYYGRASQGPVRMFDRGPQGVSSADVASCRPQSRSAASSFRWARGSDISPSLEYDFVVRPGADPRRIRLAFKGAGSLRLEPGTGRLIASTPAGDVSWTRPYAYQEIAGKLVQIACSYAPVGPRPTSVRLQIARYDQSRPLVVDPVLEWGTYLSTATDGAYAPVGEDAGIRIAADGSGCAYVAGATESRLYPTTSGALQPDHHEVGGYDLFVTKLNATGSAAFFSTYIGGPGREQLGGMAVDAEGRVTLGGRTYSLDNQSTGFPLTPGAYRPHWVAGSKVDCFATRLDADGSALAYSTLLENPTPWNGYWPEGDVTGVAVDAAGYAYFTGQAHALRSTPGAYLTAQIGYYPDSYVLKLNPTGSDAAYSTYLGGQNYAWATDIAVDAAGCAYVCGHTNDPTFPVTEGAYDGTYPTTGGTPGFITKLNAAGTGLVYSTYLHSGVGVIPKGIAADASGCAYVTGQSGPGHPATPGAVQPAGVAAVYGFVTKLNSSGSALVYSTALGDTGTGETTLNRRNLLTSIAVTSTGCAWVAGYNWGPGFPTTADAPIAASPSGVTVTKLNAGGSAVLFSSYFTRSDAEAVVASDSEGSGYLASFFGGTTGPTTPGAYNATGNGPICAKFGYRASKFGTGLSVASVNGTLGQSVTLTGTLTLSASGNPMAGRPLIFSIAGTGIGSSNTNALGVASLGYTVPESLGGGDQEIRVEFAGDADYETSSGAGTLTLPKIATKAYAVNRSGIGGDAVLLRGYLFRKSDNAGISGKALTYRIAGTDVGSVVTDASGSSALSWVITEGAATRAIGVDYSGDASYDPASATAVLTVITYDTTLAVPSRSCEIGDSIYLKAYLYRQGTPLPVSGKTVRFLLDGTQVTSTTTNSLGRAMVLWIVPESATVGPHGYQAEWPGDAGYRASSGSATLTVDKGVSYLWVASRSMARGTNAYLRSYLRRLPDYVWLAGKTVELSLDGVSLGSSVTDANGMASILYTAPTGMATGAHTVLGIFSGDAKYLGSAATATLTVTP